MSIETRANLMSAIMALKPSAFLEEHVYDRVPFVFGQDRTAFVTWKRILAQKLEVDPACLLIVGSAAVGRSLSPRKGLREFNSASDIDIAVISPYHFMVGWRYLRSNPSRRLSLDARTRNAWDDHVSNYIFFGTIAADKLLGVMPFGEHWLKAKTAMRTVAPTSDRDVKFRIYSDFEALRSYQIMSITSLRQEVVSEIASA